jgi:hypothetical protein
MEGCNVHNRTENCVALKELSLVKHVTLEEDYCRFIL